MTPDHRLRVRAVFDEAIALAPDRRNNLIQKVFRDDPTLRSEINELLRAHDEAGRFLAEPELDLSDFRLIKARFNDRQSTTSVFPPRQKPVNTEQQWIGPYQIVRELGRGGHGAVFLGRRLQGSDEPEARNGHVPTQSSPRSTDSLVAIKRLHEVLDDPKSLARFDRERELLSALDHDNIARFIDAGVSNSGEPFVVMEFIDGVPITDYCRCRDADLETRLTLFQSLCDGVSYAHQNQIIHRDLKPANVLVDVRDGQARPKIIDFGIAKAFGEPAWRGGNGQLTAITQTADPSPGTPQYMSPEQLAEGPTTVDTRADVYALGAILYELIADRPAFDPPMPGLAGLSELVKQIQLADLEPPGSRAVSLLMPDDEPGPLEARHIRQIRPDLNWIVAKAMAKKPASRYTTVDALSEDIGRYLRKELVAASPPDWGYRLQKFARRNRIAVAVAAIVAGLAVSALAGTTYGMRQAWIAQEKAETAAISEAAQRRIADASREVAVLSEARTRAEAAKLLAAQQFLFSLLSPAQSADGRLLRPPSPAMLDDVAKRADENALEKRPEVEAPLRAALGRAYLAGKEGKKAERQFGKLIDLNRRLKPAGDREIGSALHMFGQAKLSQLHYLDAEAPLQEALQIYRQLDGGDSALDIPILEDLSVVLANTKRLDQAEALLREIVNQTRKLHGGDHPLVRQSLDRLARLLQAEGKDDEAEKIRKSLSEMPPGEEETKPDGNFDQVI